MLRKRHLLLENCDEGMALSDRCHGRFKIIDYIMGLGCVNFEPLTVTVNIGTMAEPLLGWTCGSFKNREAAGEQQ